MESCVPTLPAWIQAWIAQMAAHQLGDWLTVVVPGSNPGKGEIIIQVNE